LICPEFTTVNDVAETPLNLTSVAPLKLLPVIDTTVPTLPDVGANNETIGELTTATVIAFDGTGQEYVETGKPNTHDVIAPVSTEALS
jgi:hypothetical protein